MSANDVLCCAMPSERQLQDRRAEEMRRSREAQQARWETEKRRIYEEEEQRRKTKEHEKERLKFSAASKKKPLTGLAYSSSSMHTCFGCLFTCCAHSLIPDDCELLTSPLLPIRDGLGVRGRCPSGLQAGRGLSQPPQGRVRLSRLSAVWPPTVTSPSPSPSHRGLWGLGGLACSLFGASASASASASAAHQHRLPCAGRVGSAGSRKSY